MSDQEPTNVSVERGEGRAAEAAATRLESLDFGPVIRGLTEGFVGREWALAGVETWLQGSEERFLLVSGEPGAGKSAFAARCTQGRDDVIAAHFCLDGRMATLIPENVIRSLAAQLASSIPGYGKALVNTIRPEQISVQVRIDIDHLESGQVTGVVINHLHAASPADLFDILLRRPLRAVDRPPSPRLIVIDSLDTAVTYGDANLVRLLAGAVAGLPSWVRFLCTTRSQERRVLQHFPAVQTLDLSAPSEENRRDLAAFVSARAASEDIQEQLREARVKAESFVQQLLRRAEGNFLYASIVLADVASGVQVVDDLSNLPRGLNAVYARFFQRFAEEEWQRAYVPLFGVLVAAQAPLSLTLLGRYSGLSATAVNDVLRVAGQFLHRVPTADGEGFTFFHASLRDFLIDRQVNGDRWLAPEDGHRQIALACLEACSDGWANCDAYAIKYLPLHLGSAGEHRKLRQLLLDYGWLAAKLQRSGIAALLTDFERPEVAADNALRRVDHVLRAIAYLLVETPEQLSQQLLAYLPHEDPYLTLRNDARRHVPAGSLLPLTPGLAHSVPPHLHRQFRGHEARITALALLPRRQWLISADDDGLIKIWDVESSALLRTLRGHRGKIKALAVTADERLLASAALYDSEVIIWDLETGEERFTLSASASGLAFTSDGSTLVTVARPELALWDLETRTPQAVVGAEALTADIDLVGLRSFEDAPFVTIGAARWLAREGFALPLLPSAWSDWMMLALFAGCGEGEDVEFFEPVQDPSARTAALLANFSDGPRLTVVAVHAAAAIAGDGDGRIHVGVDWRWQAHPASVTVLALDRDATVAVSGDERGDLRMWRLEQAAVDLTEPPEIGCFGLAPSGEFALATTLGRAGTIYRWALSLSPSGASAQPPQPVPQAVPPAYAHLHALLPDRGWALSAGNGAFFIWQISTGEAVATIPCDPSHTQHLIVSADGRFAVALVAGFAARGSIRGRLARMAARLRRRHAGRLPETLLCFEVERGRRRQRIPLHGLRSAEAASFPGRVSLSPIGLPVVERLAISADGAHAALLLSNKNTNPAKGGDYYYTVVYDLATGREHSRSRDQHLTEFDPVPALAVTENGEALTANEAACARGGVILRATRATLSLEVPGSDPVHFAGFLPFARCQLSADGRTVVALDAGGHLHFLRRSVHEPDPWSM